MEGYLQAEEQDGGERRKVDRRGHNRGMFGDGEKSGDYREDATKGV